MLQFSYTDIEPVWTNSSYKQAIKTARERRDSGQDWDLYKDTKLYRKNTRDCDTGEQFAFKCNDLINHKYCIDKVREWEAVIIQKHGEPPADFQASEAYNFTAGYNHKWGSDAFSRTAHGVHAAWLDLATKNNLDLIWAKEAQWEQLFTTGDEQ